MDLVGDDARAVLPGQLRHRFQLGAAVDRPGRIVRVGEQQHRAASAGGRLREGGFQRGRVEPVLGVERRGDELSRPSVLATPKNGG